MKRIAFYGGSFDPPHNGHLAIARKLIEFFALDEFFFIPAFHAPHKKDKKPTSAFHRFAMLALATGGDAITKISTVELDAPEKPYTYETQSKLKNELTGAAEIFFVIGADSWQEIDTWREWQTVLTSTNIIVVTRPDYEIGFSHFPKEIQSRIFDLRNRGQQSAGGNRQKIEDGGAQSGDQQIYITDAVYLDVSATEIRRKIRARDSEWLEGVPVEVAKYIEKYELYI